MEISVWVIQFPFLVFIQVSIILRPGHADLSGCYRYLDGDIRGTLERASARETVARVAAGAVVSQLLRGVACEVFGFVRSVGRARLPERLPGQIDRSEIGRWTEVRDGSRLYVVLARFKMACVLEGGYARYMKGGADNPKMESFGEVVLDMGRRAAELARTSKLPTRK